MLFAGFAETSRAFEQVEKVTEEDLRNREAKGKNIYGEKLENPFAEFRRKKIADQEKVRVACACVHLRVHGSGVGLHPLCKETMGENLKEENFEHFAQYCRTRMSGRETVKCNI